MGELQHNGRCVLTRHSLVVLEFNNLHWFRREVVEVHHVPKQEHLWLSSFKLPVPKIVVTGEVLIIYTNTQSFT